METFLHIARDSVLVLLGLMATAGTFVLVGKWFADSSVEPEE